MMLDVGEQRVAAQDQQPACSLNDSEQFLQSLSNLFEAAPMANKELLVSSLKEFLEGHAFLSQSQLGKQAASTRKNEEVQASLSSLVESLSVLQSSKRAFSPAECVSIQNELGRLQRLRARISQTHDYQPEFNGFPMSPPPELNGKCQILSSAARHGQLFDILSAALEDWKTEELSATSEERRGDSYLQKKAAIVSPASRHRRERVAKALQDGTLGQSRSQLHRFSFDEEEPEPPTVHRRNRSPRSRSRSRGSPRNPSRSSLSTCQVQPRGSPSSAVNSERQRSPSAVKRSANKSVHTLLDKTAKKERPHRSKPRHNAHQRREQSTSRSTRTASSSDDKRCKDHAKKQLNKKKTKGTSSKKIRDPSLRDLGARQVENSLNRTNEESLRDIFALQSPSDSESGSDLNATLHSYGSSQTTLTAHRNRLSLSHSLSLLGALYVDNPTEEPLTSATAHSEGGWTPKKPLRRRSKKVGARVRARHRSLQQQLVAEEFLAMPPERHSLQKPLQDEPSTPSIRDYLMRHVQDVKRTKQKKKEQGDRAVHGRRICPTD